MDIIAVYIGVIADQQIDDMVDYCEKHTSSLVNYEIVDVSDTSHKWDTIAKFIFSDAADAIIFKLKFK